MATIKLEQRSILQGANVWKSILIIGLIHLMCGKSFAQTFTMQNGSESSCSGTFYDSGGSGGDYGNDQNYVYTFCAPTPGDQMQFVFSFFDIENNYDFLYIYDGNGTGSPLIGTNTGSNSPGTVVSTSGCITFEFTSDWLVTDPGWTAAVSCITVAAPTCSDGIQNQGETGIDCGGPCPACLPTCSDGIQNQGETGIDCGGPCGPCPTCNDGIQNQGETGIDCGGPCAACPVNCAQLGFDDVAATFTGTHSMWTTLRGRNNVAGPYTIEGPIANEPIISSQFNEYHDLRPGSDPSAGFCYFPDGTIPVPNGSQNVMRLGAYQQIGSDASGMTTTFTVSDPYLVYYYILGFESTGHTINNRGFCTFEVRDNAGTVLPCGSFQVYENGPGESWTFHTTTNDVWLMDAWKTVTMDVSNYIGQDLTIEVWVADCQEGAHSGFGYFDFECLSSATPDCSISPLPVEMVDFEVSCMDNLPIVTWSTLSEEKNDYFTVWQSDDGYTFEEVGRVNGVGTTQEQQNYSWVSTERFDDAKYFKISQTDLNGEMEEFGTSTYRPCSKPKTKVYIDKNNVLHIKGDDLKSVTLLNMASKVIATNERKLNEELVLKIPPVSAGIYMVSVQGSNLETEIIKIYLK